MAQKQSTAFITARKGFCYLTVKIGRRDFHIMRIRNYTLDAQDKRDMRRLYPDVAFDWKKIARQLAEKREACRQYRSRRRIPAAARAREPLCGVYDPGTRTVYVNDPPANAADVAALLDAVLCMDRTLKDDPPPFPAASEARGGAKPGRKPVKSTGHPKSRKRPE